MSKRAIYLVIGAVAVAVVLFIVFFKSNWTKDKKNENYSWGRHYKYESKDPFGTYLFHQLLKANTELFITVNGDPTAMMKLKKNNGRHDLLVVLGSSFNPSAKFWNELGPFIDGGNSVLFIVDHDDGELSYYFDEVFGVSKHYAKKVKFKFSESNLNYDFYNPSPLFKEQEEEWNYFTLNDSIQYHKMEDELLNEIDNETEIRHFYFHEYLDKDKPNFLEISYAEGSMYVHLAPIVFTNYFLVEEKNVRHLETFLSRLNYEEIIYCTPESIKRKPPERNKPRVSPLQYILSNPSLTWAYYVLLGGLLLFFIFNLKRKQRPVQVLPPRLNTTLEFVDAVSKVYYQKHNNKNLVAHKYKVFTTFLRSHYHIQHAVGKDEYYHAVAMRSGIERQKVEGIFNTFNRYMKLNEVSDEQLITLHKLLDNFYKYCK